MTIKRHKNTHVFHGSFGTYVARFKIQYWNIFIYQNYIIFNADWYNGIVIEKLLNHSYDFFS